MPIYLFYWFKPWLPADMSWAATLGLLQPLGTQLPRAAAAPCCTQTHFTAGWLAVHLLLAAFSNAYISPLLVYALVAS
jgi:hypothetical protein